MRSPIACPLSTTGSPRSPKPKNPFSVRMTMMRDWPDGGAPAALASEDIGGPLELAQPRTVSAITSAAADRPAQRKFALRKHTRTTHPPPVTLHSNTAASSGMWLNDNTCKLSELREQQRLSVSRESRAA